MSKTKDAVRVFEENQEKLVEMLFGIEGLFR